MGRNMDQLQEEYRTFLLQKINHAGGFLQFQHLSGLLQQLRFEIKDTFGATKSALMKFLKANPNIFKVSKGVVTIVNSTIDNNNYPAHEVNVTDFPNKTSAPKIENGIGHIFKIFSRYAIIKIIRPIMTYVFFTPLEYGAGKDSLTVDLDISMQDKVGFNAVHGHGDYEIEYRATKVWKIYEDENEHPESRLRNEIKKPNKFTGEGVIMELLPNVGFISVSGEENQRIFFDRNDVRGLNIRCGDQVEFVARYISNEWQATEIRKKKNINKPPDHSETCINKPFIKKTDTHISEESIKNEPGKIYPYSEGAVIKFGKNFSELADGDVCNFYLYGIRVAHHDVATEFFTGDDVKFDAVKSKDSPRWKAVLMWVGEKPATVPDKKFKENFDTNEVDHEFSSGLSSEASESRRRNIKNDTDVNIINRESKLSKNKAKFDGFSKQNFNSTSENYPKGNTVASKMMPQKLPHKDVKSTLNKSKKKYNKNFNDKYNQRTSKSKFGKVEKNSENLLISRDPGLDANRFSDLDDCSEIGSEEDNELQDSLCFPRKFLKEEKQQLTDTSDLKEESCSENEKTLTREKSSTKTFEAIDGKVINLYCKFGAVKSSHLMKDADFLLNDFYINGKSVEEQQITDLKEIINVGDIIKFNCYESIDDNGEFIPKVTAAWKGPKPDLSEKNTEQFIPQQELRVPSEPNYESRAVGSFNISTSINFDEPCELNLESESSLNDEFFDASQEYSEISKSRLDDADEHRSSDVVHHEKLPAVVLRKLETCGLLSSNSKDALNVAQEIIDLVLEKSGIKDASVNQNSSSNTDSTTLCSSCTKIRKPFFDERTAVDAEVQTIVTGEIVATRNGQPSQKKSRKNRKFIN